MKKNSLLIICLLFINTCFSQYDSKLVDIKSTILQNETYSVVRMSRFTSRIKVKYFAARDEQLHKQVYQRYLEWKQNKNIIAVSSGTYMTDPNAARALPVGICVDAGKIINRQTADYDGLVIVYASGGMVASDIKDGDLTVKYTEAPGSEKLDIKKSLDKNRFLQWASREEATVFQTHLFVYKNKQKIYHNASTKEAERRFLAVCKRDDGNLYYYLINLPDKSTLLNGVVKAMNYLSKNEDVDEIVYMINLDPGSQDVFQAFDSIGKQISNQRFQGKIEINNAANLLVFYYE